MPWLTAGAVVDSKRPGSGRDRGPTRQARGGEASGQPGSDNFVMSAENEPVLLLPDPGGLVGVY